MCLSAAFLELPLCCLNVYMEQLGGLTTDVGSKNTASVQSLFSLDESNDTSLNAFQNLFLEWRFDAKRLYSLVTMILDKLKNSAALNPYSSSEITSSFSFRCSSVGPVCRLVLLSSRVKGYVRLIRLLSGRINMWWLRSPTVHQKVFMKIKPCPAMTEIDPKRRNVFFWYQKKGDLLKMLMSNEVCRYVCKKLLPTDKRFDKK